MSQSMVVGVIRDARTQETLIGAHIRNITTNQMTYALNNGAFKLPAAIGDSLMISHIGYRDGFIQLSEDHFKHSINVDLEEEIGYLDEVHVSVFPEYSRFKQLILETEPIDTHLHFDLPKVVVYRGPTAQQMMDPALTPSVGIRFDLGALGKKGKEQRKYEKLLEQKGKQELAYRKFNREWVASETKLEGDELTDFMAYCKFTIDYLAETSLFEIHQEMMALLETFKSKQEPEEERFSPGA